MWHEEALVQEQPPILPVARRLFLSLWNTIGLIFQWQHNVDPLEIVLQLCLSHPRHHHFHEQLYIFQLTQHGFLPELLGAIPCIAVQLTCINVIANNSRASRTRLDYANAMPARFKILSDRSVQPGRPVPKFDKYKLLKSNFGHGSIKEREPTNA